MLLKTPSRIRKVCFENQSSECMMEMRQDGGAGASWENVGDGRKGELPQAHGAHG